MAEIRRRESRRCEPSSTARFSVFLEFAHIARASRRPSSARIRRPAASERPPRKLPARAARMSLAPLAQRRQVSARSTVQPVIQVPSRNGPLRDQRRQIRIGSALRTRTRTHGASGSSPGARTPGLKHRRSSIHSCPLAERIADLVPGTTCRRSAAPKRGRRAAQRAAGCRHRPRRRTVRTSLSVSWNAPTFDLHERAQSRHPWSLPG
jgi:hypothetical protein